MDLIDRLTELAGRAEKLQTQLATEEATKNALVMPFINALGYDVFNPLEVVPEFTADVGVKKGEKVDYAILRDGRPIILVECKLIGTDLDKLTPSQLYRYFSVTEARFGVLTDGVNYQFFSDLDSPNKMDARPFFEFNLLQVNAQSAEQLKKFAKDGFDIENILSTASDLKYTKGIKRILSEEWLNPTEEFVRLFASRVYDGRMTQTVKDQFTEITRKAFQAFVNDHINRRLKSALENESGIRVTPPADDGETSSANDSDDLETSQDEIEAYFIVKSIVREAVAAERIYMRDTQSYCGILLDDNNRKPICRLLFNGSQKYLGLLDETKKVTRVPITRLDEIYHHAEHLKAMARTWDGRGSEAEAAAEPG